MTKKMDFRTSALGGALIEGTSGFKLRKHAGVSLFIHFFLIACMIVLAISLTVQSGSIEGGILATVIAIIFATVSCNLEKLKKTKVSLEFMSAMLSSALGEGYRFCMVIKTDGSIIFYNQPFQLLFPSYMQQNTRALDVLLSLYNVPQADKDALTGLIKANADGTITTSIREAAATDAQPITLFLQPIERPSGLFLLRGK